ncbi:hypothetical protein A5640_23460 [Mycobacterium asiaticum]|uniref:PglD N-terminal domain-containing protein n=1 Tax=Mycobacterium asiaticum TaxID=1790 RepID=A0A1A3KZH3_MYCAS|nr:hypothetical protein A5640_23460 [Mycobacterium asiaticum]
MLIAGAGGLAKEAAQLARRIDPTGERWSHIRYVTSSACELGMILPFGQVELLEEQLLSRDVEADVVIGAGYPEIRRRIAGNLLVNSALSFPNLVHPTLEIDPRLVRLGQGNMITQGTVMTCDIEIGDFNLFNWNCTVGHDARIGSFNVINPGASVSGRVTLGDACLLGTGARILEMLDISSDTVIGAGAVVTRSIANPGVYVGVPARLLEDRAT